MGWFSSDDNNPDAATEKQNMQALKWLKQKWDEKKRRDAERKAQAQKDAEEAVRKALHEDEDK